MSDPRARSVSLLLAAVLLLTGACAASSPVAGPDVPRVPPVVDGPLPDPAGAPTVARSAPPEPRVPEPVPTATPATPATAPSEAEPAGPEPEPKPESEPEPAPAPAPAAAAPAPAPAAAAPAPAEPQPAPAPAPPPAPAPAPAAPPAPAGGGGSYAGEVVAATNAARAAQGLPGLATSGCAQGFAAERAAALVPGKALAHAPLGPVLSGCGGSAAAENLARAATSAQGVVDLWMGSAGHRANILSPDLTEVGVACVADGSSKVCAQVFLGR